MSDAAVQHETETGPCLSERETQLLETTLELLYETGYDKLTVDEVVARARASKATVYRRWPSKADLVVAAFAHGVRQIATVPDTGSLRGDLLHLGNVLLDHGRCNGAAIGGVMAEVKRSPKLRAVFEREFLDARRELVHSVLRRAVDRGEITPDVISDEIWDLLPAYVIFRSLSPSRPPTEKTIVTLVDDVLLPSLTRTLR
jgi:AcrR family transcriptional regulator